MDTSALEAAAQRYKRADDALTAARDTLQTEAVNALRSGVRQAEVARITKWSREYLRRLRDAADKRDAEAEVETLRRQVAELQAAQSPPKTTSPATATRPQVTQSIPDDAAVELPEAEVKRLVAVGRLKAIPEQQERLRRAMATATSLNRDPDIAALDALFEMGLLTDDDVQR